MKLLKPAINSTQTRSLKQNALSYPDTIAAGAAAASAA